MEYYNLPSKTKSSNDTDAASGSGQGAVNDSRQQPRRRPDDTPADQDYQQSYPQQPRKSRGLGCGRLLSCRTISFVVIVTLLFSCVLLVFTITNRPPILWEPLKVGLNRGITLEPKQYEQQPVEVISRLENQITSGQALTITESDLDVLINDRLGREVVSDITPDGLILYINLEQDPNLDPLWGRVDVAVDEQGQIVISRVGTELIAAPQFIEDALSGLTQQLVGANESQSLVDGVLSVVQNVRVKNVTFTDTEMQLDLEMELQDILPILFQ